MYYHIAGIISSLIFFLTIGGIFSQLEKLKERSKAKLQHNQLPSAVLSTNQAASSFLAFFSFYIYGLSLARFNYYLVGTRFPAILLTLALLFEIARDRKDRISRAVFIACTLLFLLVSVFVIASPTLRDLVRVGSSSMILVVTAIIAQGYLHQVLLIRRSGATGAVSKRYHQLLLAKDLATMGFSLSMGLQDGWPVMLLASVSALTKIITLWHFRWARLSPLATTRRDGTGGELPEY